MITEEDKEVLRAVKREGDFTASSHDHFEPFSFDRLRTLEEEGYVSGEGHSDADGYWHFRITPKGKKEIRERG